MLQGVRSSVVGQEMHNKSQLDNIVGSLWQARQESSGSSLGNQVREIQILAGISSFDGNSKYLVANATLFYIFISQIDIDISTLYTICLGAAWWFGREVIWRLTCLATALT